MRRSHDNRKTAEKLRNALLARNKANKEKGSKAEPVPVLSQLFPSRRFGNLLEGLENYVSENQMSKSGYALEIDTSTRQHAHGSPSGLNLAKSQSRTKLLFDEISIGGLSHSSKKKLPKTKNTTDTETKQIYAGITHSDLDIQYSRPPLMHQMNVLEWLWLQSDNFHRIMLMIMALLLSIFLVNIVFAGIFIVAHISAEVENPYLCDTEACQRIGRRLLKPMNKSVKPCDDFYGFVCGTTGIDPKDDKLWVFGSSDGRISYDYYSSKTLARLFHKQTKFPVTLILPFYKACLNEEMRNKKGLEPFYNLLKKINLYSVSKKGQYTKRDVISAMAAILTNSLTGSAILDDKIYMDEYGNLQMFVVPSIPAYFKAGGVLTYSYDIYKDTVKKSFMLLTELNVPAEDLEIIADDIICLEFTIKDRIKILGQKDYLDSLAGDPSVIGKSCPNLTSAPGDIPGNFGMPSVGNFDWEMFATDLYERANPGSSYPHQWDPRKDPHQDHVFLSEFESVFKQSSALRLMRYLQWRLFYSLADELSETAYMTSLNVRRHHYRGIPGCVQRLFTWLPFLTPNAYMHSFHGLSPLKVEQDFEKLTDLVKTTYLKVISRNKFKEYEIWSEKPLPTRNLTLFREVVTAAIRNEDVPPVTYEDRFFSRFRELYKDMTFTEDSHFENIMKMGYRIQQWQLTKKYQSIYYGINPRFHVPIWMDKLKGTYDHKERKHIYYMPFATTEIPFFYDGLFISDLGGVGWVYAGAIELSKLRALDTERVREVKDYLTSIDHRNIFSDKENYTMDEIDYAIMSIWRFTNYHYKFNKFWMEHKKGEWKFANEILRFKYKYGFTKAYEELFIDQERYHVLSILMEDHFGKPENWKQRKVILKGLEKFNANQLFYINQVNLNCQKVGKSEFDHVKVMGPLLHRTRANVALSNVHHFAKAFKCPKGSNMNPDSKNKRYFWDKDLNISNFKEEPYQI